MLISGGGAQLLSWRPAFMALLVDQGFHVVRFDNRDVGLSQRFGGETDHDGGYGLSDMGDDVLRVLDALGVDRAHLAGHSMGGMIAQMAAIDHPERVASLSIISSIPGRAERYVLHGDLAEATRSPLRFSRDEVVEATIEAWRPPAGAPYAFDEDLMREDARTAYDRGYFPEGFARQWSALMRAPERLERLRAVTVPALLFHGRADATLHWVASVEMAQAMPDAELHVVPDMGHLMTVDLWPSLAAGIVRTARRGEADRSHTAGADAVAKRTYRPAEPRG